MAAKAGDARAMAYTLNVNGKVLSADVDGDTPLLWTLRDALGIVGPKYGCGVAACGACTVHVDGQPMRSCQIPTDSVGKAKITTIEGMATHPVGKKVQAAWMELDVAQCGYCQPGQIMSATALLAKTPAKVGRRRFSVAGFRPTVWKDSRGIMKIALHLSS